MTRLWYWAMPAFAIPVAGVAIYAIVHLVLGGDISGWGIQTFVTFVFFFPGLLLSLGVSQLVLSRRRPRTVVTAERVMIGILVGLTVFLGVSSLDRAAWNGLILGPLIVILAITLTITIAVNSSRLKQPAAVPAAWVPATEAPPAVAPSADAPPAETSTADAPQSPYGPAS